MEAEIRGGEEGDLPGIVEIYNHYVTGSPATFEVEPVRPDDRRSWFAAHRTDPRHRLVVAVDRARRVVGWATTSEFRPRAAYATTVEASIYLRAEAVGHGIGSRLYASLLDAIREADVERIVAGICLPNDPCVALHRKFGFTAVGVFSRVGRKFGRYWDVAWFERPRVLEPTRVRGSPSAVPTPVPPG
jgi:phosphinothricin acetyltransferase